jgi:hypothetical protein
LTVVARPLTLSVGACAPHGRLHIDPSSWERSTRRRVSGEKERSVDTRTQRRSRSLGLEASKPLRRAFRRLAEPSGNPKVRAPSGGVAGGNSRTRFARARAAALVTDTSAKLRARPCWHASRAAVRPRCVRQTPCNPHFQRPAPDFRGDYRTLRVASTARWVTRFHGAHPLRPASSVAPFGVLGRIGRASA